MSRDNRLLAFSLACWGLGEGLFIYIEPLYLRQLGANPVTIGAILSIAAGAAGLAHIPAGYVADHLGRKPVLLAGWLLGLVSVVVMFLAQDLWLFSAALVAYTFTGFVIAPIYAYAAVARGTQSMQRALTLVSAGFYAGTIISPALGSLITHLSSLRMVFGAAALVFIFSTVAILLLTPQPRDAPPAGRSRYGELFRNWRFLGFLALIFSTATAMQVGLPLMPNFVVEVRGYDVALVGLLGSANSIGVVALNLALGQRLPRRGYMLAQACLAMSLLLMLVTTSQGWLFAIYFLRAGWYLAHSMAAAQVGRVVETAEFGLAFGLMETVSSAATVVGPLAAGLLYARAPAAPFIVSLVLIVTTIPLVWRFAPRRDAHTVEPVSVVEPPLLT
jgi:DHA1 family multidrug resistance protein-like MFS transporter